MLQLRVLKQQNMQNLARPRIRLGRFETTLLCIMQQNCQPKSADLHQIRNLSCISLVKRNMKAPYTPERPR